MIRKINSKRENKIEEDPLLFLKKHGLVQDIKITNAASLLFSREPLDSTEIQIGLFESETVIKKSVTFKEDLLREVELVMDFIMSHIYREYIITQSPEREERWQYPLPAIREFLINAIIHRDYRKGIHSQFKVFRDRIELWNIGKLPADLTIADLYKGNEKSLPRNIKIADIFKEAFLIEKYGSGIKRAVKELNDYHLPLPLIEEISGGVNVIIYANRDTLKDTIKDTLKEALTNGEKEAVVMQKIREKPTVTADELSRILNINLRNTKKYLTQLMEQGKIMRMGSRKTGYWQVI